MAQALVPLKDLVTAKTRLAGLLRPSERRALAQAMVEDVLQVLVEHPDITRVTLVSDDPGAELLARKYGADYWSERSLECRGLNAVVQRASERLLAASDELLLVLHGDLPLLSVVDVTAVLEAQQNVGGLVIGCDRQGSGTNLLAFDRASVPPFCFGADSCAAHIAGARRAGVPVQILQRSGIGIDIDEAQDLQVFMARTTHHSGGKTAELLHHTELGLRLALALKTLLGEHDSVANTRDEHDGDRGLVN